MEVTLKELTIDQPVLMLNSLKSILKKAEAHCLEKKIEPSVLLSMRLAPDMFPLLEQVQIAADGAKMGAARLAQVDPPKFPDDEKTFAELQSRLDKTIGFLTSQKSVSFEKAESTVVRFPWNEGFHLKGRSYLIQHALPNFYFHLTAAYAILRHAGVPLGKADFLGAQDWLRDT